MITENVINNEEQVVHQETVIAGNTQTGEICQENEQENQAVQRTPDKADYKAQIKALSAEDQAFLDGYLFAKATEAGKRGA